MEVRFRRASYSADFSHELRLWLTIGLLLEQPVDIQLEAIMKSMFLGREKHGRSLAKAISWRTTGTIDTFVISYLVTGKITMAGAIAAVEVVTKIFLYYFHERIWAAIPWGHRS